MPDILTDADMADATPVLTDADMADATPVVDETPPVLTDADMVDAKPVMASASPKPDVLTDEDMLDAVPVAQPSDAMAPLAPAVGAQPSAPMPKIGAGERIRLSRKAETGSDASTLEAIGAQLTLGAQPVVDVINKSALQQLASGRKKTFFRGEVPFSELPDYEISNMAKMANLDMPFMDSPLKQWDKTKGAAITDPKMRRAERAKFIQTEATNELKRRLQGKMDAGEKLSKSDQTLWARLAGGAVDNTGYTGAFMRGPVGAVLGPIARRYGDLQTDEQTLVDGKIETTEKGDTQGTAMAKGAAGGSAEYAIEKFGTEAANFILGNTLKRIPGLGPALSKASGTAAGKVIANVAQKFRKLGEVTGKQNLAGEIFAEELPQQLVDVGLGLDKRESAKLMGIGSDTAEAFKSFVKPENVGNMALEMLLMQAAQGTAASVSYYDAYSKDRNRLDGTLTAFGANPDLVKKASIEEKRGVLKALSDKLTPDKATAILDKLGKRAGDLHDNIVKQEGYDFDANQYGITSRFALPAEGDTEAWGTLDDGSKLYEGADSGIGLVARPDGTATLYGRDGTVEDYKSVAEAADAANKLSVRDQVNDVRRGQKAKFVESTARRLAPDVNVRVHNTTEDLLEAVPAVKDSPDFEDNPSGIAIGDTIHVVLDNIETPRGVISTILHEAGVHAGLGRVLKGDAKKQFLGNLGSDAVKKYEEATSKMGYMQGAGNTEEALAYMYEQRLANPTGFQRGISWLHNQLRKVNPNYNFTDSDIDVMLADAQRSVRNAQRGSVTQPASPVPGKARETAEMNAYERKALELEESYPAPAPATATAETPETVQPVQRPAPKLDLNAESQKRMNEDPQAWVESLRATKGDIGKAVSVYDSLREESSPVKPGRPVLHSLEWFIENGMSPEAAQMAYDGERGQGKTEVKPVASTTPVQPEAPKVDMPALLDSEKELVSQRLQARMKRDEWSTANKLRTDGKSLPESENPFVQPFKDASKKLTAMRQSIYKADPSLKPVFGEKQEKESFKAFFEAMNQNGEFDLLLYWHEGRGLFAAPDGNDKEGNYDPYRALPKSMRKIITGRTKQTPDQVAKEIAGMDWGKPEYADSKTGPEALVSDWVYQYNRYLAWKAEGAPSLSEIEGRRYEAAHRQEQEDLATYRQKVDNGDVLADGSLVWVRIDGQVAKQAGIDPEYPVVRIIGSKVKDGKLVYELESVNHDVVTVFADAIEGDYGIQEEVDYDEPTRANLEREDAAPDVPAGEVRDDSVQDVEDAEREAIQGEASLQSAAGVEEAGKEAGSADGKVAAPALTLESASIEELDAEKRKRAESEEVKRRSEKPIAGTAGDMTGTLPGMEGTSDVPLFTEQKPVAAKEKQSQPVKESLTTEKVENNKQDMKFVTKSGETVSISVVESPSKSEVARRKNAEQGRKRYRITAKIEGKEVGFITVSQDKDGNAKALRVEVDENKRRQGIARSMHSFADKYFGTKVVADVFRSGDGNALWDSVKADEISKPISKNKIDSQTFKRGTKAVATLPNGTLVSGEVKGTDKDGKVEFRAFKVRKFGSKAFTPYPVNADGTPGFKDSFVDADKVRPIDASADVTKLSPEEQRKLKMAERIDAANADNELRMGNEEAPSDVVDRFNSTKERKEQRKTDNMDVRFRRSSVTPGQDKAYADAVAAGDMAKAQEMVDAAARVEGYTVGPVWHGTRGKDFNVFDMHRKGWRAVMFDEREVEAQGVFFSPDEEDAKTYGKNVRRFYLKAGKQLIDPNHYPISSRASEVERATAAKVWDDIEYILSAATYEEDGVRYIDINNGVGRIVVDEDGEWISRVLKNDFADWDLLDNKALVDRMKERGYDTAMVEERDDKSGFSWFVTDPDQIKSADPATYDDQGNLIPLSARFDDRTPDIRFRRSDASVDKLMEEVNRQDVADNFRALPSTDPKAREIQADVQVSYAYNLTRKTVQKMQDEARGVYEKDKTQAQLDLLAGKKDSGDVNTDARRMATDKIAVDDLTMDAVSNPDDDQKTATAMLGIWRWYERGTDVARAMRLRFDPVDTPEGRRAWILRTLLAPTKKEAEIIQRSQTTADAIEALKVRANIARKVMVSLKAKNIDVSKLTASQLMDDAFVSKIMQEISTARSGWGDMVHEWWRNAILSAPTTQIVNTIGNAGNAALEAFIQRPVEALINTVAKNDRAASLRSVGAMYRAIVPSISAANAAFLKSWKTEKPVSGDSAKVEESNAAIPTKFGGKIIRTPQRMMMATDEWFKTVFMAMLTADYATREFDRLVKEGKQKESNREDYVLAQVDKDSSSYAKAWEETLRWSFQQKPGHMAGAIMNWRNDPTFGFLLKFIFPFVKTPANIISTGIRKTPLNALPYIYKAATGKYSKEDAFRLGAEQAVGMVFMSLLYGMMEGDDDDPLNRPRITGSKKTTSMSPSGEKEAEAQDYPPMSVRVGDKWVSYARLEPFATMTATMVDALTVWKQAKEGKAEDIPATLFASIRGNFADKTFLQGVGNMVSMIEGDEFAISKAATSTLAGFNPNIIRSTVRAFDPYVRDTKANKGFLKKLSYQAMPSQGNAPSPKIDKAGQPIKKEGGGVYNSLVPFRLQSADKTTKIDAMVKRYNESVQKDDRRWPSSPSPITVRLGKEKIELTPDEFEAYKRSAGEIAQRRLKSVNFNFDAPTESDMDRLEKVYAKARDIAKDKIRPAVIRRFTKSKSG